MLPPFDRHFFASSESLTRIGDGELGGKANGLVAAQRLLRESFPAAAFPRFHVAVPRMAVLPTGVFDAFLDRGGLAAVAAGREPDERIGLAFQRAALPAEVAGDLRALTEEARTPLAIRSSSRLEDALELPFAGVYGTKMIPNDQPDPDTRFQRLVEAVKFVWASTFFSGARAYARAAGRDLSAEKMAVIVQEVVGRRHADRFYPQVSGVARSVNFYPIGTARPADGVISLALGLGKTIVDGGVCWSYSPARPAAPPPFASTAALLAGSQLSFWAVRMGRPPVRDPLAETEYLVQLDLAAAEYDDTLRLVASTYDAGSDRLWPGTARPGPRVVDFGPLLRLGDPPLNDVLRELLRGCEGAVGTEVEIEFAVTFERDPAAPVRLGFLQVRPMAAAHELVDITPADLADPAALVVTEHAAGNGSDRSIADVVYVVPGRFDAGRTRDIAGEIERINAELVAASRGYLLIGFGRWGSADPWLGIPVEWGQIAGARAIVEATLPQLDVDASQGSHFFHNMSAFHVSYLMVHHAASRGIDWAWFAAQPAAAESEHVRHLRLAAPLLVKVDGRTARGLVRRGEARPE